MVSRNINWFTENQKILKDNFSDDLCKTIGLYSKYGYYYISDKLERTYKLIVKYNLNKGMSLKYNRFKLKKIIDIT